MHRKSKLKKLIDDVFHVKGNLNDINYLLFFIFVFLIFFGILMLMSASSVYSYQKFGSTYYMFWHQILYGFLPGLFAFYFCLKFDFRNWKKFAFLMLIISIVLLVVVFIPGIEANYGKARSWINVFGISVQPSEIVKLTFLIYLASWLDSKGDKKIRDLNTGLLPFVVIVSIVAILMLLQPDLGTLSIIIAISLISFFVGGADVKHMLWMLTSASGLLFLAIKFAPYRAARLMVFLDPSKDPQGIGYHLNQSLIAVGSGGIFGVGLGYSRQKYGYLPEVAGDSIFGIIGEELGFLICIIYVFVIFAFVYQGFKVAKQSKSYFGRILATGIVSWLGFQSFINISSMIGLLPMTGVPLPFVSYGGTAMIMNMASVGILLNISKNTNS
ncbi:MAG: putative lipid II flippase FtsW [Patescibacteria group bacterium]|nr:putative lipid II flippase FtsW [Patescibacteria group bacterium]MDD4304419.1 putative lipid II flippase FtsW [Patescibacteria group bacterium]MDD4695442.1 putative lipid II flippase FtsW [Patescibacteria group bacterium]